MAEGRPWLEAKVFDGSAVVGEWLDKTALDYPERPIAFSLRRDGEVVQEADSSEMIHSFDALIAYVSRFQTLRMGDRHLHRDTRRCRAYSYRADPRGLHRRAQGAPRPHQVAGYPFRVGHTPSPH